MIKTKSQAIQDWKAKKLGPKRKPTPQDKHFVYEYRKKSLPRNLSPQEYEEALVKISKELGL